MEQIIAKTAYPTKKSSKQLREASVYTTQRNLPKINENPPKTTEIVKISAEIIKKGDDTYLTTYTDEKMTPVDAVEIVKTLSVAFPTQSVDFYTLMTKMMIKQRFTKQQAKDAVEHYLTTSPFPPKIADIVGFNKLRKIYDWKHLLPLLRCNGGAYESTDCFKKVYINGMPFWYLPSENML